MPIRAEIRMPTRRAFLVCFLVGAFLYHHRRRRRNLAIADEALAQVQRDGYVALGVAVRY